MNAKFKEVSIFDTKALLAQLEKAIEVVAAARIQAGLAKTEFETEVARVERCIEAQYKVSKNVEDYNVFALDFIKANVKALVFDEVYAGQYLDDVIDVKNVYCKEEEEEDV